MWRIGFIASVGALVLAVPVFRLINGIRASQKGTFSVFKSLFAGVFVATMLMFIPVH